jgi:hypothetical protein
MTMALVGSMLALLLTLLPARAASWPDWQLPAPLQNAGRGDLLYPSWFAGQWLLHSDGHSATVRFGQRADGAVVGDRAFNADSIGRAVLGDVLLGVEQDPANPNRQLARLRGDQLLESTVVARRSETTAGSLWTDELALQVVHNREGAPRVSRVETLSRYQADATGRISGDQWQATYPSPAKGLVATPLRTAHWQLTLEPDGEPGAGAVRPEPVRPPADPAS